MFYAIAIILAVAIAVYWRYRSTVAKDATALKAAAKADVAAAEQTANSSFEQAKAKLDELLGHGPKAS